MPTAQQWEVMTPDHRCTVSHAPLTWSEQAGSRLNLKIKVNIPCCGESEKYKTCRCDEKNLRKMVQTCASTNIIQNKYDCNLRGKEYILNVCQN